MSVQAVAPVTSLMVYVLAPEVACIARIEQPSCGGAATLLIICGIWRSVRWARDVARMEETRSQYEM